jgi:hypothetical protein
VIAGLGLAANVAWTITASPRHSAARRRKHDK